VSDRDPGSDGDPIVLPGAVAAAITGHALADAPHEACGFVVGWDAPTRGGVARRYVPCRNALASPSRYSVHPDDLLRLAIETERSGEAVWAVVHSHVGSPAVPSPTDLAEATWPGVLYLVVSLAAAPSLRGWWIDDGAATEVELLTPGPGSGA
jgi:proteasome lid subunit RPN8/RPN11